MPKFRPRTAILTAYQYTGTSMDAQVANLLGVDNCVAATATRPALVYLSALHMWQPLRPGMWATIGPGGVSLVGNQWFVMNYLDVTGQAVPPDPIDPGPDPV